MSNSTSYRFAVASFFFISGFNFASWTSRIPTIQKKLQLSDASLGTLLAALPLGLLVTMPFVGKVVDKYNTKKVLLLCALLYTLFLSSLAFVNNSITAACLLFLFGAARNFFNISINTQALHVQTFYSKSIVTTFHGIWSLAALAGAAVSFIFIAFESSIYIHFFSVSIVSTILILLSYRYIQSSKIINKHQPLSALSTIATPILLLGLIGFVSMVCEGTMSDWSSLYFEKVLHIKNQFITAGYITYLSTMVIGRFMGDRIITQLGVKKMLYISSIILVMGFSIAVFFPSFLMSCIGFACIGFGVSCIVPAVYVLTKSFSNSSTASAIAAVSTISYCGFLIGPPTIGYIAKLTSLQVSFFVVGLLSLFIPCLLKKIKL